ncbi:MAG: aminopeptidase P family protein [Candidatus Brockarchaeota archaeon]|nr:aminopeptidase P family protein [Candidatus Brockarchaeota archaeon]MBO3808489.1 aminopeptidase P family protein [Candidatus Brockarchaeota archaeon]
MASRLSQREIGFIAAEIIEETRPRINLGLRITREEYEKRWSILQNRMSLKGYDVAYACGSELDRSDIAWLAGVFDPIIERYGILVPSEGKPVVLAGPEGGHVVEEAVEESGADIVFLKEFQISDEDYRHACFTSFRDVLKRLGVSEGSRAAILSSPQAVPYEQVALLQKVFGVNKVFFDEELLQRVKYEKSDRELAICEMANIIADAAFRAMLAVSTPGMRELEVAGVGDYVMKELGAGRTGFPTIVTSGERNYTIIGPATNRVIQKGDMVSMGVSPAFNGYHGVIRRTFRVGEPMTRGQREFHEAVEGLYRVVMEAVQTAAREDLPSNYIDQQGKQYLENLKLRGFNGVSTPIEPYTFIHNTGCSECQEGYGAVTPYTTQPLGSQVALMIDVALLGFRQRKKPLFETVYDVIEDAFWKKGREVGVFNRLPLNVETLVGNTEPLGSNINPYHKRLAS